MSWRRLENVSTRAVFLERSWRSFEAVLKAFGKSLEGALKTSLREKCLYLELFWSLFSRIWTEYAEIRSISPYSIWMRENTDQNNSEYRHFSHSACDWDDFICLDQDNLKMSRRLLLQTKMNNLFQMYPQDKRLLGSVSISLHDMIDKIFLWALQNSKTQLKGLTKKKRAYQI